MDFGFRCFGADDRVSRLQRTPARYYPKVLRALGAEIGQDVTFRSGLAFDNVDKGLAGLNIGERAYIGPGVFFDLAASITMEPEAVLAPKVVLITHGDVGERMLGKLIKRKEGPIVLKKGCWVGTGALIMPGVTVGECAVVGAGAVVTGDVPDYTVVAGVPARSLRKITDRNEVLDGNSQ